MTAAKDKLDAQFARNDSCWQQGAAAGRAGKPHTDCPYNPVTYDFVTWTNGWAFTTHLKAKEDDEL